MTVSTHKTYIDTPRGQIHVRELAAAEDDAAPPLVCLHPSPYSGAYYETAMPLLNQGRRVIAPDYPGYGGSYSLTEPPSIEEYASAMLDSVFAGEGADRLDVLGFHSGCLVGAEIARRVPDRIRHLVLIDVPFFDAATQQKFYPQVAKPLALSHDLECLRKAWEFNVSGREGVVPLERAHDMFVDNVRSGTRDYFCFHAAFTYDCAGRFAELTVPCTVIATTSPLKDATLAAAAAIDGAALVEEPQIETSVFEQGAPIIAAHISRALGGA